MNVCRKFILTPLNRGESLWNRGKNPKRELNIIVSAPQGEENSEGKRKGKERENSLHSSSSMPTGDGGPVGLSASMPATLPSQLEGGGGGKKQSDVSFSEEIGATQEVFFFFFFFFFCFLSF